MKMTSMLLFTALVLAVVGTMFAPNAAFADDSACIKREQKKGVSACIAKAKCSGITSRKQQAQMCGG